MTRRHHLLDEDDVRVRPGRGKSRPRSKDRPDHAEAREATVMTVWPSRETVQAEPGLSVESLSQLRDRFPVNSWAVKDFYFGGVNAVQRRPDGSVTAVADGRRQGAVAVVPRG